MKAAESIWRETPQTRDTAKQNKGNTGKGFPRCDRGGGDRGDVRGRAAAAAAVEVRKAEKKTEARKTEARRKRKTEKKG